MEVVPEEKERGKNLRNSVNSLQPLMKSRGHGQKKGLKSKSQQKYVFDRSNRKAGVTGPINAKETLKNIQLKNGLKTEGVNRVTD